MNRIFIQCNKIYDRFVDKYLHVETAKCNKLDEHDNIINFMYEPSPYFQFKDLFNKYPIHVEDHLVDVGCGKGRVLIMAAEYGCRNLYGVDISNYLLEIAQNNLKYFMQKHNNIKYEIYCTNAKKYKFNSQINKVFFYNPFQLKIFIHLFKSLVRSIDFYPRKVTVFFWGAQKSTIEYFDKIGRFELIGKEEKRYIHIYVFSCCCQRG